MPVPLRGTLCGEPGALSVTSTAAERAPVAVGLKVTPTLQLAPAARVLLQVWFATMKEEALVPDDTAEVSVTAALPLFVRVMV